MRLERATGTTLTTKSGFGVTPSNREETGNEDGEDSSRRNVELTSAFQGAFQDAAQVSSAFQFGTRQLRQRRAHLRDALLVKRSNLK